MRREIIFCLFLVAIQVFGKKVEKRGLLDVQLGIAGSGLAFGFPSNSPPEYDRNQPYQPDNVDFPDMYNQTVTFSGYNLQTLSEFTIEFWSFWWGSYGGFFVNVQTPQTLFFYGDNTQYFAIQPTNGSYSDTQAQGFQFPYSSAKVGGIFSASGESNVVVEGLWCHYAVAVRKGSLTSEMTIVCPEKSLVPTTVSIAFDNKFEQIASLNSFSIGNGNNSEITQFVGEIDELRIWNKARSTAEINEDRYTNLNGDESGLIGYYKFDEATGTTTSDSSSFGGSAGVMTSTNPAVLPLWTNQFSQISTILLPPMNNVTRKVNYNGSVTVPLVQYYKSGGTARIRVKTFPTEARVCYGSSACTTPLTSTSPNATVSTFNFQMSFVATRGSCLLNQTAILEIHYLTGTTSLLSKPVQFNVMFGGVSANVTSTAASLPTTGGTVVFNGNNFGIDGPFHASETVDFTYNGVDISCVNPVVSLSGTRITCTIGGGVGVRNLKLGLCRKQSVWTNVFSYMPPTITSVSVVNSTTIRIDGSNFGPTRTAATGDSIMINGTQCNINSIATHNTIYCSTGRRINDSVYDLNLSIGGQSTSFTFNFTLCANPCQNGGICVGLNLCDCSVTGFNGTLCNEELPCFPKCVNGTCIFSNIGNGTLLCSCKQGWTGISCSELQAAQTTGLPEPIVEEKNNTPLIAGASAGGAGLIIIILVIVVIVLATRRKEKRGTSNFIPLEKKDFTKIIYGEQLSQSPEKHSGDLRRLEELLVADNLELAFTISSITQITEADKIAKAMVVVFEENEKVLPLLEAFVNDEVRTTEQAGTLFRSNSMVSKMFKFYSRLIGLPYLYVTIGPEMDELIADELGLEVDPEKMEDGTDLDEMRWTLMAQSQKILKAILNSVDDCPAQFRQLFGHIKRCVAERFPENVNTTIGGFIFLRFFCPAVSSPEAYGIVDEPPSASARRLLILITKVLQNLSNDVEFGSKEPYMTKMNDFIQSNRAKLSQFYEKLVKPSPKVPISVEMPKNIKQVSLSILSLHIRENLNKIENPELRKRLQDIVESS